jgi:hypothetical protein
MNLPSKNFRRLPGNLEEFQSTPLHDGNILSVDFYICKEDVKGSGHRQKLGGASYDTFSVQYQKNNFYLARARKPMWVEPLGRQITSPQNKCFWQR